MGPRHHRGRRIEANSAAGTVDSCLRQDRTPELEKGEIMKRKARLVGVVAGLLVLVVAMAAGCWGA
jgi:hypothetical protein